MGASARKRKAQAKSHQQDKPPKTVKLATPPDDEPFTPKSLQTVTSDEELEITLDTLKALSAYPALIKTKPCRELRVAVHEFRQACTMGINSTGTNLTARISAALADGKYLDARILLAEMRIRQEEPKLGALCRWVRDLDVISGLSTVPGEGETAYERSEDEMERLHVLDGVLRTTGILDTTPSPARTSHPPFPASINVRDIWDLRPSTPSEQVYDSVLDKSIFEKVPKNLGESLSIIEITEGAQRKPPNHHQAILYTTTPNATGLSLEPRDITYHPHPIVPGLGLATNVLSHDECRAIIAAGESVGFLPDSPIRKDGDISILAHNFYWVVDTKFHDLLWARISPHIPSVVHGRVARGINRRFRVYRYVPGAEYRCHIDGAWPPSGTRPDGTYVYDDSPEGKKQSSLLTFLVYLNDEFEGGETTFFLPASLDGTLNAYPVRPVMGGVSIFTHGETHGALLHEGTGVRKGAKYIIRTDVEYDVEPTV